MAHPCTISRNTLKVYHTNNVSLKQSKHIESVNLNQWKETVPKSLSELCIDAIANNWEVMPLMNELPLISDITKLLDVLRTDLPLELTVPKIAYESFWLRSYKLRWPKNPPVDRSFSEVEDLTFVRKEVVSPRCSPNDNLEKCRLDNRNSIQKDNFRKTWKDLYLEMHVQEYLQNLDVEHYDSEKIKTLCDLCEKYVSCLKLRELKAPTCTNIPDHIPLSLILLGFSSLKELCLCFKQKCIGDRFSWHIFNTTMTDIKNLAKGLESTKLEILRIQNSDINCTKIKTILRGLYKNDQLKAMEFSHCKIADHGTIAIAKFIKEHNTVVKLNLVNNYIGYDGTKSLAYVLMDNDHLTHLNLRLNIINSKGGRYLFFALTKGNNCLKELNLAGCGLNFRNVEVEEMLRCNDVLDTLDISNNRMGKEIGGLILKGLQFNTTIINIDTRRCEFSSQVETKISEISEKNRYKLRSKEVCWDPPKHQFQDTVDDIFPLSFLNDFHNTLPDYN